MKKLIALLLICVLLLTFVSCFNLNGRDENSTSQIEESTSLSSEEKIKLINEKIAEIDTDFDAYNYPYYSLSSTVNTIEDYYSELTDEEKNKVINYHIVEEAKIIVAVYYNTERFGENACNAARSYIKSILRNPSSYEEISCMYSSYEYNGWCYARVTTSYRAENGFGGMTVETQKTYWSCKGTVEEYDSEAFYSNNITQDYTNSSYLSALRNGRCITSIEYWLENE